MKFLGAFINPLSRQVEKSGKLASCVSPPWHRLFAAVQALCAVSLARIPDRVPRSLVFTIYNLRLLEICASDESCYSSDDHVESYVGIAWCGGENIHMSGSERVQIENRSSKEEMTQSQSNLTSFPRGECGLVSATPLLLERHFPPNPSFSSLSQILLPQPGLTTLQLATSAIHISSPTGHHVRHTLRSYRRNQLRPYILPSPPALSSKRVPRLRTSELRCLALSRGTEVCVGLRTGVTVTLLVYVHEP